MTTKVVYNACFGGFGLSKDAVRMAKKIAGPDSRWQSVDENYGYIDIEGIERHDPVLVEVVEKMGDAASGSYAELTIAEIEGQMYRIDEYDGNESVQTPEGIDWVQVD